MSQGAAKKLSQLALVTLDFRIWKGSSAITVDAQYLEDGKPISGKVCAESARKFVIDPKVLRPLYGARKRAQTYLSMMGVPFLEAWAVPLKHAQDVRDRLQSFQHEFEQARDNLLANYDSLVDKWIAANPDSAEAIQRGRWPRQMVAASLQATFNLATVQPIGGISDQSMEQEVESLSDRLLDRIATDAATLLKASFDQREGDSFQRKLLNPFNALREKLANLSFLDGAAGQLVTLIDGVQSSMPPAGAVLRRPDVLKLQALAGILANRSLLQDLKDGKVSYETWSASLAQSCGVEQAADTRTADLFGAADVAVPLTPEAVPTVTAADPIPMVEAPAEVNPAPSANANTFALPGWDDLPLVGA